MGVCVCVFERFQFGVHIPIVQTWTHKAHKNTHTHTLTCTTYPALPIIVLTYMIGCSKTYNLCVIPLFALFNIHIHVHFLDTLRLTTARRTERQKKAEEYSESE